MERAFSCEISVNPHRTLHISVDDYINKHDLSGSESSGPDLSEWSTVVEVIVYERNSVGHVHMYGRTLGEALEGYDGARLPEVGAQ